LNGAIVGAGAINVNEARPRLESSKGHDSLRMRDIVDTVPKCAKALSRIPHSPIVQVEAVYSSMLRSFAARYRSRASRISPLGAILSCILTTIYSL
jgi:hypothetical protein